MNREQEASAAEWHKSLCSLTQRSEILNSLNMFRFILLLNHDDLSLSAYLRHCLQKGEQFVKTSSNIFTFTKTTPSEDRIAVVTYVNEDPDLKMKFQMEDYSQLMKKRGWKVLQIGSPEDIFDSRRHVFLQTSQADIPFPAVSPDMAKKAQNHEKRSLLRCITMLLLLLGFGIFFLSHDPDIFLSSDHILIPCLAAVVFGIVSAVYCIRGAVTVSKKSQCADGFKNFLAVDKAVLFCMLTVFAMLAALLFDMQKIPNKGYTVVSGEKRVTVYQDDLPLTMNDLDMPMRGNYHSSRLTERNGLLMQSLYGFEQSFSDPDGTADLSLISYAVYKSEWKSGLDWVYARKGLKSFPTDENLARLWGADALHTDGHHRISLRYPGIILVFSTSGELAEIDPEIVLNKLQIRK